MDQYLSSVIIAAITGLFSIITLLINKKYGNMMNKIDRQAQFFETEKDIKYRLSELQEEQQVCIYDMIVSTLDTNIQILKKVDNGELDNLTEIEEDARELRRRFADINSRVDKINGEYKILLKLINEGKKL